MAKSSFFAAGTFYEAFVSYMDTDGYFIPFWAEFSAAFRTLIGLLDKEDMRNDQNNERWRRDDPPGYFTTSVAERDVTGGKQGAAYGDEKNGNNAFYSGFSEHPQHSFLCYFRNILFAPQCFFSFRILFPLRGRPDFLRKSNLCSQRRAIRFPDSVQIRGGRRYRSTLCFLLCGTHF